MAGHMHLNAVGHAWDAKQRSNMRHIDLTLLTLPTSPVPVPLAWNMEILQGANYHTDTANPIHVFFVHVLYKQIHGLTL